MHHLPLIKNSERGAALLMVMIAVAVLTGSAIVAASVAASSVKEGRKALARSRAQSLLSYISMTLSDPVLCSGSTVSPELSGLMFFPGPDKSKFDPTTTDPSRRQDLALGTNLGVLIAKNTVVTEFDLEVEEFYLTNVSGSGPFFYGDVYVRLSDPTLESLKEVNLGTLRLQVSPSGPTRTLVLCEFRLPPEAACANLGCTWDTNRCSCPRPALSCAQVPNTYVHGYSYQMGVATPICKSASYNCPNGQFLAGFDSSGRLSCVNATSAP